MGHQSQRGDTIVFTFIAVAVVATVCGCFFGVRQYFLARHRDIWIQATKAEQEARAAQALAIREGIDAQLEDLESAMMPSVEWKILAWNVESRGSDPTTIANQLEFDLAGYTIYGLTEVNPNDARRYLESIQVSNDGDFKSIVTQSGGDEGRMMIVYDSVDLKVISSAEIATHDGLQLNDAELSHRSPLAVRFNDNRTDEQFVVVLNHLARKDAQLRLIQAKALRLWAAAENAPVIGIGDYNFDWDFRARQGNEAFQEFTRDAVWHWVEPETLIDTNWSDQDSDGMDDYPDSCLDMMFVSGDALDWNPLATVIERDRDFPDDNSTSDHRPVELVLTP